MRHLELTDRTRDALRRISADIFADPARYLYDIEPDDLLNIDTDNLRGVRVWKSILKWVDDENSHLALDAERIGRLTKDCRLYLTRLDADHATERALAVPMHVLAVMQEFEFVPDTLKPYLSFADMSFEPAGVIVKHGLRDHPATISDTLFRVLDDRRLHDIFDLSHRDVEAARRAIKRARYQEDSTRTWLLPDHTDHWLRTLAHDVATINHENVRFATYNASELHRFATHERH